MASYLIAGLVTAALGGVVGAVVSDADKVAASGRDRAEVAATYLRYAEQRGLAAGGLYACSKTLDENEQRRVARITYGDQLNVRLGALERAGSIEPDQRVLILAGYWRAAEAPRGTPCYPALTDLSRQEADRLWALLNGSSAAG